MKNKEFEKDKVFEIVGLQAAELVKIEPVTKGMAAHSTTCSALTNIDQMLERSDLFQYSFSSSASGDVNQLSFHPHGSEYN